MAQAVIDGPSATLVLQPTEEYRRVPRRNFGYCGLWYEAYAECLSGGHANHLVGFSAHQRRPVGAVAACSSGVKRHVRRQRPSDVDLAADKRML
jgi:hypothetical protein